MAPEDANSFGKSVRGFWPSLQEECYSEKCSFEEVKETLGNNERAVSTSIKCICLYYLMVPVLNELVSSVLTVSLIT